MLDFTHLLNSQSSDVQIFSNPSALGVYSQWQKPRGVSMVYILAWGAGGGGGGGQTGAATLACSGSPGGGSGAQSTLLIPAILIPDTLYVQVGLGGNGGAANSSGTGGTSSNVAVFPYGSPTSNTVGYLIGAAGGGGGTRTANTGGTAGTAGAVGRIADSNQAGLGIPFYLVGQASATGAANTATAGGNVTQPVTGLLVTGGAGGGGCTTTANGAGGNISATGFGYQLAVPGGVAGVPAISRDGGNGIQQFKPLLFTGGAGGASANNGIGGAGGRGAFGCGGGGGAGGTTGGAGGQGGDGLVIIIAW